MVWYGVFFEFRFEFCFPEGEFETEFETECATQLNTSVANTSFAMTRNDKTLQTFKWAGSWLCMRSVGLR
jgi:hypothetical protein